MTNRRHFLKTTMSASLVAAAGSAGIRPALAQTVGGGPASWAGATDPALLQKVWDIRFTTPLPWALDPTNTVLAKALNVDAAGNVPLLGVTLKPNLPAIGFVLKPDAGTANVYTMKAGQTSWPMLGPLGGRFKDGSPIPVTTLWGYGNQELESIFTNNSGLGVTFPARSFVVQRNAPITVHWLNQLVDASGNALPHLLGIDQTISMQVDPQNQPINGVPIAVHHHGGNTAAEFDGGPDQWFTPQRRQIGPGITAANSPTPDRLTYVYANDDEASMHWYHDHGEAVTRINAYAGLAGLYVVRDANETALVNARLMPTGEQEIPVVIQDKVFQADGNLAYTADMPAFNGWNTLNPAATRLLPGFTPPAYDPNDPATAITGTQPTISPEMFGDVIVVNGVAWPNLQVERRQYRLRLLNGSDSRVYRLRFGDLRFFQVGTDVGLLNIPVLMTSIVIAPGERKDIVIDFAQAAQGAKLVVTNDAPFPYPNGVPTLPTDPWATVMQIDVSKPLNETVNKRTSLNVFTILRGRGAGTPLVPLYLLPPRNVVTRQILLAEGCDEYGRITPLLGTVADGTKAFADPPDIFPKLGATEVWEFWNVSPDAHPIHMHLVRFRVVNRQAFTATVQPKAMTNGYTGVSLATPPVLSGFATVAPLSEQGWKDTVLCMPGEVTRVVTTFQRPGKYVYHCHILGHEEHDMMRWFQVK